MIPVHEILLTIQGEGTRAGLPCVLVRTLGCNLRCRWCDTDQGGATARDMTVEEILAAVQGTGCDLVEITGGEPLIHEGTPLLVDALLEAGLTVLVETNGSLDVARLAVEAVCIMDVKAPSSGEQDRTLWTNIEHLDAEDEVKIVVADEADYEWARSVVEDRLAEHAGPVLLSPLTPGLDPAALAGWILRDGLDVRLGIQLHKLLFPGGEASRRIV